jgi:RHS repeat-associated protein
MQYHAPSGLYLTKYRAYDPKDGRWLSRDPIGEAGGINLYAYVGGNPVRFVDLLGLATIVVVDNAGLGHVGVLVGDPTGINSRTLYDPNGSYRHNGEQRPSGDTFTNHDFSFYDYLTYQTDTSDKENLDVYVYVFDTTSEEEKKIKTRIMNQGGGGFMGCAVSSSSVLNGIGPFEGLGWYLWPSSTKNALDAIVKKGSGNRMTAQKYISSNPFDAAGVESGVPNHPPLIPVP